MAPEQTTQARHESCEICSRLADHERSFEKFGWEEMSRSMPPEAGRLVPAEPLTDGNQSDHVERCPLCGTFYRWESSYDYLAGGSEDSADLTRLSDDEAERLLARTGPRST